MCMSYYVHCIQALFVIGRIIVNMLVEVWLSISHRWAHGTAQFVDVDIEFQLLMSYSAKESTV